MRIFVKAVNEKSILAGLAQKGFPRSPSLDRRRMRRNNWGKKWGKSVPGRGNSKGSGRTELSRSKEFGKQPRG